MKLVKHSLDGAEIVFTDSSYAKERILHHYDLDPGKFVVVPCAWQHMHRIEQDDSILGRLGLESGQFFFSLGSRFPYKNFRWVEAAARQNPRYRFVVTGNAMHWEDDGKDAPVNVTFTGYLSDGEVKALEAHCRAFLHPSLEEGFGIPPMEAMSSGARCIISTAASLPEVYGDSVWYVDPTNYDHIDLDEIMSRLPKGANEDVLSRYSWENSARIVLDAIEGRCL
ncbi:glycosyltransferase family 1 protein [Paratractidigestivibacter sp.]|uniref:glycosyltransferase family 4 protein n=1 Tax=Paratractidigestivibacter sp. TaxID=2847316 RepID=UPI002ACB1366|nr:glycosyltransferase family 1 protein [Paratractidigestivibacter sp.]